MASKLLNTMTMMIEEIETRLQSASGSRERSYRVTQGRVESLAAEIERERKERRLERPAAMADAKVRKWLHDVNNRIGMILANAELLQLEQLSAKAQQRRKLIEEKSLELRQIIRDFGDHLFS